MPDEQWFWHVSEGVQGTVMPPWRESLTDEQRWKVIHYIQQVYAHPLERDPDEGGPSGEYANLSNPLPQTVETLDQGKHIFIRECWSVTATLVRVKVSTGATYCPFRLTSRTARTGNFTDADYFWRISEGVPWSAMPVWKLRYSMDDRWALAYYIQVNFTQALPRPSTDQAQVYPDIYLTQEKPKDLTADEAVVGDNAQLTYSAPNVNVGKTIFTSMCAHCHGLSGLGDGWDGAYLDVKPADFTKADIAGLSDGDWLARVSYGYRIQPCPVGESGCRCKTAGM